MCQFKVVEDTFRIHPEGKIQLPKRATKNACAYDFYSPESFTLSPGEIYTVWTDIKAQIPDNYMLALNVRSSMGKKQIQMANTQGWIDADYFSNPSNDGNIGIMLHNYGNEPYEVKAGDRIAQGMIIRYYTMEDDDTETLRTGGFGSTNQ